MSPTDAFDAATLSTYAWAFGQGVLVDLTPCVYPLIPITVAVFGAKGVSRGRALFLASAYVLGMATLYTTLGIVVALSGGQFGAWLGEPVVVLPIVAVLLALAASMFGAFELQLPASVQTRLNAVGGTGPVGAFLMGLVSGFISAPCTGPVLLSLLAVIAKGAAEGDSLAYGASLLFTYALGMGTLFFAVALGASLFRPGRWMEYVKSVFGVALLVMSLWFLAPLSPELRRFLADPTWGVWLGAALTLIGLFAGAIHLSFYGEPLEKARKGVAVTATVLGIQVLINNTVYVPSGSWKEVHTIAELEEALTRAQDRNLPVVIDFGATWCAPCLEMEKLTFHHEEIEPVLESRFELIKIDVTQETPEKQTIKRAFSSETLPSVLVFPSQVRFTEHFDELRSGTAMPEPAHHFHKYTPADQFGPLIAQVQ
ncbi:thioredoxin family protein [Nannocystis sp. ILAH1]|uniref:protein-disulfide reductase DsbD family protein n=1 Tax=unclassified Nannocystis TaxID=2627009 RepID=UPI00226E8F01|nr:MULTISPECIES: cytochrome c biogenesis protein CcdA [unclassified Nannocystis]MCY0994665.1 thioredoxin family protein [Nannocystis sp. ILAH1]MCY1068099.1 thioredoxin family protein [Nannocystis sp. RBIL2]